MRGRFRAEKRLLFHAAVRLLQTLELILPRRLAFGVFAAIGRIVFRVDRAAVRRSLNHLQIAFGDELTLGERRDLVRESFEATGRNFVDLFRLARKGRGETRELVQWEGREHLDRALADGRGVVALSAHFGNWEVLGAALAQAGYPVHVVAREVFDNRSDQLLNRWRRSWGLTIHPRTDGLFSVVRALRSGGIVGTLVDQDTGGPGAFVNFFGRAAKTPTAPFVLARRTGAALVPMWIHLGEDGVHRVRIESALEIDAGFPKRTIAAWHDLLEAEIRRHPQQWVWHHRRWKSRPPGQESSTVPSSTGDSVLVLEASEETASVMSR